MQLNRLRVALVALGVAALAGAAALWLQQRTAPAPYRYEPVPAATGAVATTPTSIPTTTATAAATTTATAGAGAASQPQLQPLPPLQRMRVVANDDGAVLAEFDVAAGPHGPVRMDWHARVDDPLLQLSAPLAEVQALAAVLARHRREGVPVLAWWDTSRQLQALGAGGAVFDQPIGEPLYLPARWSAARDAALRTEHAYWGSADAAQRERWGSFARALVAPEEQGVALLRSMVPGRGAIVVLHLRDMLLLGQMDPKALAVGFQDFADSGDVHRSVRGVHGWLREGDQSAYAVMKLPDNQLRVVALKDAASGNTLAARLLPFIGNKQDDVAGLTLVWRGGGFVVYELDAGSANDPKDAKGAKGAKGAKDASPPTRPATGGPPP